MKLFHLFTVCLLFSKPLQAQTSLEELPWLQFDQIGEARLNFVIWPVFTARLYSETEYFNFPSTRPFALQLEYLRKFTRQQLVEETRQQWLEMASGSGEEIDNEYMTSMLHSLNQILKDVNKHDAITLYVNAEGSSSFYFNEKLLGVINDTKFSEIFAGIWLSDQTTRPGFRKSLLGLFNDD